MAVFEWSSRYATGYASVDAEYKRMVDAVNVLFAAVESGRGASVLGQTFLELKGCLEAAFAEESRFMRDTAYAGIAQHEIQHDRFRETLRRCEDNARVLDPNLCAIALASALREWIFDHVLVEDRELFSHVRRSSRPPAP